MHRDRPEPIGYRAYTVGRDGRVRALIHASSVRIEGQVDGDIHGDDFVELIKGARVTGNIFSPCVSIDKGAHFNGKITMVPPERQAFD